MLGLIVARFWPCLDSFFGSHFFCRFPVAATATPLLLPGLVPQSDHG